MSEEQPTGVIGRGESIITKQANDIEAENSTELAKQEDADIEAIKESMGWYFPKVKLAAWVSLNFSTNCPSSIFSKIDNNNYCLPYYSYPLDSNIAF